MGDVLYSVKRRTVPLEKEWVALVKSVAAGDLSAFHELYARTQRLVHQLTTQISRDQNTADNLTRDVFHHVWSQASTYNPVHGTVVGWIMNQARSKATGSLHVAGASAELVKLPALEPWTEPEWDEVAPGLSCKVLADDTEHHRVSMLVRLAPKAEYPPHRHAGVEELHLLEGELWIDDRKIHPGDYNRAEPGTSDKRVWSETGCACVLVASTRDELD